MGKEGWLTSERETEGKKEKCIKQLFHNWFYNAITFTPGRGEPLVIGTSVLSCYITDQQNKGKIQTERLYQKKRTQTKENSTKIRLIMVNTFYMILYHRDFMHKLGTHSSSTYCKFYLPLTLQVSPLIDLLTSNHQLEQKRMLLLT